MNIQRLRNLTTGKLHTEVSHIYQDLEYITGQEGLMTHMLPSISRAIEPWLKDKVKDERFWDKAYDATHTGEFEISPMNDAEQEEMLERCSKLPSPFGRFSRILSNLAALFLKNQDFPVI